LTGDCALCTADENNWEIRECAIRPDCLSKLQSCHSRHHEVSDHVDCRRLTGKAAIEIGEGCLHLHGGTGVTEELFVGPALKRLNFLRGHVLLNKVAA